MTRLTCDRCDCVPVIKANERLCPAGGLCIGTSMSSDDGKVRVSADNPSIVVSIAKMKAPEAPTAPQAAPKAPQAPAAPAPKATASSVAPEAPEAAPTAPASKVN